MNVCIFNNIFDYLQASPADYEKAVVAAKEAWETWAEVTGINQIIILCIENNKWHIHLYHLFIVNQFCLETCDR